MIYLQAAGCILVASSPEILCRLDSSRVVTNRCAHTCHLVQTLPDNLPARACACEPLSWGLTMQQTA